MSLIVRKISLTSTALEKYKINLLIIISISLFSIPSLSYAQEAGKHIYEFMTLSNSARVAAFGSNFLPTNDNDLDLAYSNPSLISKKMNHQISLNYLGYFAGAKAGFVSYAHNFNSIGTLVGSLQFINYGTFDATNTEGQKTGRFSAGEYAFIVGWSKKLNENIRLGVNIKNIYSKLESYSSYGIAADLALSYFSPNQLFSSSLLFKNMGRQITTYTGTHNEKLPFEIQMGIAKKFEHAPLRLLFLFNDLQRWNIKYQNPNTKDKVDPFTGEVKKTSKYWDFADNAFRHVVVGAEFVPGKGKFMLRMGYNFRRQQEMKIASRSALVGFSFGFGIQVYKFKISYTRAVYHLAGGTNTISIGTNFDKLFLSENQND